MTHKCTNPEFLDGVPELLILHLLSARAMYGYQLVQAIRLATKGAARASAKGACFRSCTGWKLTVSCPAAGKQSAEEIGACTASRRKEPDVWTNRFPRGEKIVDVIHGALQESQMSSRPWLEIVEAELFRRRLPRYEMAAGGGIV